MLSKINAKFFRPVFRQSSPPHFTTCLKFSHNFMTAYFLVTLKFDIYQTSAKCGLFRLITIGTALATYVSNAFLGAMIVN
ncbi:MAG: hypothetical protein COB24_11415 [Hyphomicrobiales bacterium]|nr:MAG: hypothetical protein COB24_11415 [Hyphomicrobiales bacterium]